ncbi:MAG: protein-tyrosine phosphatase family protein [Myxococcota bacterium]
MNSAKPVPFERAYWADRGRLMGGCYPGDPDPAKADGKIRALLACGIRTFVNLMEPDEVAHAGRPFVPYADRVTDVADALQVDARCLRHPIRDLSTPSVEAMTAIQRTLEDSIAANRPVFVHCWGGRGRTGTVIGIYLIRRGLATTENFVDVISRLREADAGGGNSPETRSQVEFVRRFS